MKKLLRALLPILFLASQIVAQSTTPNLGLRIIPSGQTNWGPMVNANWTLLDTAFGNIQNAFQGPWVSTTTYAKGQLVTYQGATYISTVNQNLNYTPGVSQFWVAVITAPSLNFMGPYNAGTTYPLNAIVNDASGSSYVSLVANNVGNTPASSPTQWAIFAAHGVSGTNGVSSLPQLALTYVKLPLGSVNILTAAMVPNVYVDTNTGGYGTFGGYYATGINACNSGASMVSRTTLQIFGSTGIAFYDQNNTFISGASITSPTTVGPGGTFACPNGAAGWQATLVAADVPNADVEFGTTLASSYQAPRTYPTNVIDAKDAAVAASSTSATNSMGTSSRAAVSQQSLTYINELLTTTAGPPNLFYPTQVTQGVLLQTGNGNTCNTTTTSAASAFYASAPIPVIPNTTYTMKVGDNDTNNAYGLVWLDGSGNCTGTSVGFPFTNGQNFTSPPNALYARFSGQLAFLNSQMFTLGTSAPSTYYPPPTIASSAATSATVSNIRTATWAMFTDSIGSIFNNLWQGVVTTRTGMAETAQDGRPGRLIGNIFECYGALTTGSTLSTYSSSNTFSYQGTQQPCSQYGKYGWTNGNTLAQNLAGINYLGIALGTNNENEAQGTPGDAPSANTVAGDVGWALTTIHAAAPQIRVFWITNEYTPGLASASNAAATANTICNTAFLYGDPCLNMDQLGGVNSQNSTTLLRDTVHPTDWNFQHIYGPTISEFITRWY